MPKYFRDKLPRMTDPLLRIVKVPNLYHGMEEPQDVALPIDWYDKFSNDNVKVAGAQQIIGRATLACSPGVEVAFTIAEATPEAESALQAMAAMQSSGLALALYECRRVKDVIFTLTESPGDEALSSLVLAYHQQGQKVSRKGQPLLPPHLALNILIDLLRGLEVMARHGILHTGLDMERMALKRDNATFRPIISDFSSLCFVDEVERACAAFGSQSSAYYHAPEMLDDCFTGHSNNVWQVGLIFLRMLAGGNDIPTVTQFKARVGGKWPRALDLDTEGRRRIRDFIANDFDLRRVEGIADLGTEHRDLVSLAEGMLHKDPTCRWSAAGALHEALLVAGARDIEVLQERQRPMLPEAWFQTWQ